ncbi:hypothetical protein B6D29_01230 [Microgenomates bacterium UTCPR1]|nr:MAG: hypothetical protein B6D29_01230 [Microgenomates bacterium UTCPR1]
MKKKMNQDVIELIGSFQKTLDNKPTVKKMYEEIQMMRFKVKPIKGDLSTVNLNNDKFIRTLWSLGKLDEFFQKEFYGLNRKNKELFSRIFESIYEKYQVELNRINIQIEKNIRNQRFLEVEIFKESKNNKIN